MAETDKNAIIRTYGLEKVFDGAVPAEFKTVKEVPMMRGAWLWMLLFGGGRGVAFLRLSCYLEPVVTHKLFPLHRHTIGQGKFRALFFAQIAARARARTHTHTQTSTHTHTHTHPT